MDWSPDIVFRNDLLQLKRRTIFLKEKNEKQKREKGSRNLRENYEREKCKRGKSNTKSSFSFIHSFRNSVFLPLVFSSFFLRRKIQFFRSINYPLNYTQFSSWSLIQSSFYCNSTKWMAVEKLCWKVIQNRHSLSFPVTEIVWNNFESFEPFFHWNQWNDLKV